MHTQVRMFSPTCCAVLVSCQHAALCLRGTTHLPAPHTLLQHLPAPHALLQLLPTPHAFLPRLPAQHAFLPSLPALHARLHHSTRAVSAGHCSLAWVHVQLLGEVFPKQHGELRPFLLSHLCPPADGGLGAGGGCGCRVTAFMGLSAVHTRWCLTSASGLHVSAGP